MMRTEQPSAQAAQRRRLAALILCSLVVIGFFAHVQFSVSGPLSYDAYYHLALGREIARAGPLERFVWTPHSIFAEHFADKELLFHMLLAPISGLPVSLASQLGSLMGQVFFVASFALVIWRNRVPHAGCFVLALAGLGSMVALRLAFCRPHPFTMGFSLLVIGLIISGRWPKTLFCAALLHGLVHTGGWITVPFALIWGAWCLLLPPNGRRRLDWQPVALCAGGFLLGQLIHPNFPDNLRILYLQNVVVPFSITAAGHELIQAFIGPDAQAPRWQEVVEQAPAFIASVVALTLVAIRRELRTPAILTTLTISALFLFAGAFVMKRLIEIGAPIGLFALALALRDCGIQPLRIGWRRALWSLAIVVLVVSIVATGFSTKRRTRSFSPPLEMAKWLGEHGAAGETVFTASWADSAPLMYFAPQLRSIVVLDPNFLYAQDEEMFVDYAQISLGLVPTAVNRVIRRFDADWITVWEELPPLQTFLKQVKRDERTTLAYRDRAYSIWKVRKRGRREKD